MPSIGPLELVIILVIILLLFGGSRLAGLGKSTGRALKEFKEETRDLNAKNDEQRTPQAPQQLPPTQQYPSAQQYPPAQQQPTAQQWQQPPTENVSDPSTEVRKDA